MKSALQRDGVTAEFTAVPGSEHVPVTEASILGATGFFSKVFGTASSTGGGPSAGAPSASPGPGKLSHPESSGVRRESSPWAGRVQALVALSLAAVVGAFGYAVYNRRRFAPFDPRR